MIKQVSVALGVLAVAVGCSNQASDDAATTTTTTTTDSASAQGLTTQINTVDGRHVADATIDFSDGYATVTVETVEDGILSPGFHSMHIHQIGVCEAGDGFASAGEHFQAPGHTGMPASGDLPPLLVRSNGAGKLVATSDAFTEEQLTTPQGSSIVLHESAVMEDPAAAERRIACGVLSPGTAGTTSVETQTTVVTTTAVAPPPPATTTTEAPVTTTPPVESPATTTPPTETNTVTVTETPSPTTTTVAPPPGG
ncbi:superoxide dismutase family protein [Mycobacterium lehmannii]|uniref:superoxide dismutase family protein n=1 Tax=Mycobacterium lehmannii TaxID=2048550 RepID=UPI000AE58169|nr:superoxide dismutase family protein [Mycobacterium lehmannii]